jgi:gluconokinase
MIIVLMGVSGSGKTTIGKLLSQKLGWPFLDGDDFHPASNIEKMSRGIPLTDDDRLPWLQRIAEEIRKYESENRNVIFACSALKEAYRKILKSGGAQIKFVLLEGSFDLIHERLATRKGHFMKPEMLQSQFEALEETPDLIVIDIGQTPEQITNEIAARLTSD